MVRLLKSLPIFEVLWDIAFSVLVLRLAFFYYGLTFLTGCIMGFIRHKILVLIYKFPESRAEIIEMPFMVLAVALLAKFIVARFDIPKIAWLRLVVGLLALLFMLMTEFVGRVLVYGDFRMGILQKDAAAAGSFTASLVVFGLMPWLLMLLDGKISSTKHSTPM